MKDLNDPYNDILLGELKKVYVCSPVRGDQRDTMTIKDNIARAVLYSRYVYNKGYLPICPHIYLGIATGLNESDNSGHRLPALRLGLEMLLLSDELWVFGRREGDESEGMKREIEESTKRKIPVKYRKEFLKL